MTLVPGSRLGSYEITAKLGEGGMGEVYRATDTKLKRDVAIKVLPAAFTEDKERLARFEREAQLLAQLQHPNIASIYGLEEKDGTKALVMELVEGPTLAERLEQGPLPFSESLSVSLQIVQALEEAHEKGIVHRDLKPQNIKASIEGKVKVLDFGLAKAMDPAAGSAASAADLARSPTLMQSPTLTAAHGTQIGMILGTAAYMAPEQARGVAVDKRADIWAFGVVLFEMLSGRSLFGGDTLTDTLAGVLKTEIDFSKLPAETPAAIRRLLRRCLQRDPKLRLRDIGEARIALAAIAAGEVEPDVGPPATGAGGVSRPRFVAALAGVAVIAGAIAWQGASRSTRGVAAASGATTEFAIEVDRLTGFELSPDGRHLAWIALDPDVAGSGAGRPTRTLVVRSLDDREPRELASGPDLVGVYWSRDGAQVAFASEGKVWRVAAAGGERQPICDLPTIPGVSERAVVAGAWLDDETLAFAVWRGGLYRVPTRGGDPVLLVAIDPEKDVAFGNVRLLPDGKSLLLLTLRVSSGGGTGINGGFELFRDGRRTPLPGAEAMAPMLPIGYARGTLFVVSALDDEPAIWGLPFDAERSAVTGNRFLVVSRVSNGAVARNGTMAWAPMRDRPTIVARVGDDGRIAATLGQTHPGLRRPALSPDGSRLALVLDRDVLWVHDLARDTLSRLVEEETFIEDPQWSPDGRTISYTVGDSSVFRRIRADPGAEPETIFDDAARSFLAPDGTGILFRRSALRAPEDAGFFWATFGADGRPGPARKLLGGPGAYGRLSPDGKLLAYGQTVDGRREAFLTTFPALDQTLQLSSNGGGTPQWSPDGRSVVYLVNRALTRVEVGFDGRGRLSASPERRLFAVDAASLDPEGWTVAPDGNGFLFVQSLAASERSEIVVAENGVQRALPATGSSGKR